MHEVTSRGSSGSINGTKICKACGTIGEEFTQKPGNTTVQVVLFILGLLTFGIVLLVWLAYVVWRIFNTKQVCPGCKGVGTMIALSSPMGKRLEKEFAEAA